MIWEGKQRQFWFENTFHGKAKSFTSKKRTRGRLSVDGDFSFPWEVGHNNGADFYLSFWWLPIIYIKLYWKKDRWTFYFHSLLAPTCPKMPLTVLCQPSSRKGWVFLFPRSSNWEINSKSPLMTSPTPWSRSFTTMQEDKSFYCAVLLTTVR